MKKKLSCITIIILIISLLVGCNLNNKKVVVQGGILAETTQILNNGSCKVKVIGKSEDFKDGDTLIINYGEIQGKSGVVQEPLEVGDVIAVTYSSYEVIDDIYEITIKYIDLVENE